MLTCPILLFVSTFSSSVAIDYAGKACYDSLLSTCVESMILANKNTSARRENLCVCRYLVFWMSFIGQFNYFQNLVFVDMIDEWITKIGVVR